MMAVVEVDSGQPAKRGKATDEEGQRTPPPQPVEVTGNPRQPTPDHPPDTPHRCLAVVEVDAGQAAKRGKATDEEAPRTPPPPPAVEVARKPRQPTPDHPPYCWMIGEAIDALAEYGGGSKEDAISSYICARYPGVPPAHDRLLRHYLVKHVAEGIFVRTAAGRYERSPEESADEELPLEQADVGSSSCKPASVEAKRARCKPRRDGSPLTPPAGRKDGATGAQWMTPAAAAKDCVPVSPVVVADKDESQAPSLKPKRRGRLRRLGMATTTDSSRAGMKDGNEVPYTLDKGHEPSRELALVILGDSSSTPTMDKSCTTEVPPTKPPVDGGQPLDPALVTTTEVPMPETAPMPTPAMDKDGANASPILDKNDSICTRLTAPEPGSRACTLALMAAAAAGFVPVLVADKKGGHKEAPYATYEDFPQPRKAGPAPTAGKKAGSKALSATPKGRHRQPKSATLATGDRSAITPGKKLSCKVSFASPKSALMIPGGCPASASVADQGGMEASAALKQHGQPRKLFPVTADEISDDPGIVLLALPSQTLAVSNA